MDIKRPPKPWYVKYRMYILGVTALLAIVVYTVYIALQPRRQSIKSESIKVAAVQDAPFMEFVETEGIVQPIMTIQINSKESGYVDRIVAEEGTMLHKGDTILILQNPELIRSINEEHEQWQKSMRNLQEQEIQMEQKSISLNMSALQQRYELANLERTLAQAREEFSMGIKSRAELDIAEEKYKHEHQKLLLQMESLRHDSVTAILRREMLVSEREAAARKLSNSSKRIDGLVVRAPMDGQLGHINLTIGQSVGSNAMIGELKIMNEYKVHTQLSEYYVERISAGLPATIIQKQDTFPLRISRVVPEVKDRKFDTDLLFTGTLPENIRLGKSYRVKIELGQPEPAIIIPRGDFYQKTGGRWIYRIDDDGIARRVEIKIGRQNPEQYEVIDGLEPGQEVIVSGYDRLGDVEEIVIN